MAKYYHVQEHNVIGSKPVDLIRDLLIVKEYEDNNKKNLSRKKTLLARKNFITPYLDSVRQFLNTI